MLNLLVERAEKIHVGVDPGTDALLQQLIAKPIRKWGNTASPMPHEGGCRKDACSVLKLHAFWNSCRLPVTINGQVMTLTQHRPQAGPFHSPQAVADPQGHAPKHLCQIAMRAAVARPVRREAPTA